MLLIRRGAQEIRIDVPRGTPVAQALEMAGCRLAQPCGGRGVCGKCAAVMRGDFSAPTMAEAKAGVRLVCQAAVLGEGEVILPQEQAMVGIEAGQDSALIPAAPMAGSYGAAVDIGTTTLALRLYDLRTGACAGVSTMINPQTAVAADVIGRMDAALKGRLSALRQQVLSAMETMLAHACAQAAIPAAQVESLAVTGNTTMLYLLTGRMPHSLSRAPFQAECLFDQAETILGRAAYLPPCLHAFVGADITCAILASGMCETPETALLCDIGTNGEMALWKDGVLHVASTAAGPAFEGAGISCGVGSVSGAIYQVVAAGGRLHCQTIGRGLAQGVCGSGLIDAVAAMLDLEIIDETGAMDAEICPLRDGVCLTQADIRAVQLAKAAMAAGAQSLMEAAGCTAGDICTLYVAGGFGSHLNMRSAVRIGLIPAELAHRAQVIGNAALDGAARALMDQRVQKDMRRIAAASRHVELGGSAAFAARYVDAMMFPYNE